MDNHVYLVSEVKGARKKKNEMRKTYLVPVLIRDVVRHGMTLGTILIRTGG